MIYDSVKSWTRGHSKTQGWARPGSVWPSGAGAGARAGPKSLTVREMPLVILLQVQRVAAQKKNIAQIIHKQPLCSKTSRSG